MVRIRMNRMGRRHRPFFRINAMEKQAPRDGKVLEALGWYDPLAKDASKALCIKADRIKVWLDRGAQPSDTVGDLLAREGLIDAEAWNAKRARHIAPKLKKQAADREAKQAAASAEAEAKAKEAQAAAAATDSVSEDSGESAGSGGEDS